MSVVSNKIANTNQDDVGKDRQTNEDIQVAGREWEKQAQRQAGHEHANQYDKSGGYLDTFPETGRENSLAKVYQHN